MNNWAKIIIGDSRAMGEVADGTVDLIVTSPPYWQIKDYGVRGQIGYGQSLHEYLKDLYCVWRECFRVLRPGGRLCLNIGDQFARASVYGRYQVIPLHAEFIGQGEELGFNFLGAIIWQKKTTMNTTGGANVMGSYPYPPNGLVEIDYEFIQIFKKPGKGKKVPREVKEASKLSKEEWKEYFAGHWHFGGARQVGHEAMFPEEVPRRLIKMFSFLGDTVLDPFLGSGTTAKVALALGRNALGYEINKDFLKIIEETLGIKNKLLPIFSKNIQIFRRQKEFDLARIDYAPKIQNAKPINISEKFDYKQKVLPRVIQIISENLLKLDNGQIIRFLGVKIDRKEDTIKYLHEYVLGKNVIVKFDSNIKLIDDHIINAYVYLKNKIFINAFLIKSKLGSPDLYANHKFKTKFIKFMEDRETEIAE
jgi:DNA modification methylase